MKKISIIGATITGNRGAEAMLTTTIGRIKEKYPSSEFYIYSYYPQDDEELLLDDNNISIHSATPVYLVTVLFPLTLILALFNLLHLNVIKKILPKSVTNLADSDVLIDLAGVSFMDGRALFLPFNIMTIWPAMLVGTPVVKFAQGLGTFNNILTSISAKIFLSRCKQLFARGDITKKYLEDFFPQHKNYQSAADVAFSHKRDDSISLENKEYSDEIETTLQKLHTEYKVIGLCPSSVVYSKSQKDNIDYIGTLVSTIEKLLEDESIRIFLFPNATREKNIDKLRNNDLLVIQMIISKLLKKGISKEKLVYIAKDINTDSIKAMLEHCDMTIVSRFHAMVASLSLEKPVIVLGWSHKYLEVMKQFQMQEWVIDYQDQNTDLNKNIFNMLNNIEQLQNKINIHLPAVKKESFKQFQYLFDEILR